MKDIIEQVSDKIPMSCRATKCSANGCSVSMEGTPANKMLVNMDCPDLKILNEKRCDYVFVGQDEDLLLIAAIELKSGRFEAKSVAKQLQGGADKLANWLPEEVPSNFVPILVCRKGVHKESMRLLRTLKIKLYDRNFQILNIRSGELLMNVFK